MKMKLVAALLCAPVVALSAQHIVDVAWGAAGEYRHAATLLPGKFVELCGKLEAGSTVRWQFESSAPLDFNIHYHQGKDVVYPAKQSGVARASATLVVPAAQDYCWMWTNKGAAPAQMSVALTR